MQRAVGFGNVEPEAGLAQMAGTSAVMNAVEREGAEFRLRVSQDVFDRRKTARRLRG